MNRILVCIFILTIAKASHGKNRDVRFSFFNPFDQGSSSSVLPIPVPPLPNPFKSEVPDHCKDPLKRIISFMVSKGVSSTLSFIEPDTVPEFTQELRARHAGETAENIIQVGLTEGNMARAVARAATFDLKLLPFIGSTLAAKAEPQVETATRKALDTLCSTMNCCFD